MQTLTAKLTSCKNKNQANDVITQHIEDERLDPSRFELSDLERLVYLALDDGPEAELIEAQRLTGTAEGY